MMIAGGLGVPRQGVLAELLGNDCGQVWGGFGILQSIFCPAFYSL